MSSAPQPPVGCTLFSTLYLFWSSYPIIFQPSSGARVKGICLQAFISSIFWHLYFKTSVNKIAALTTTSKGWQAASTATCRSRKLWFNRCIFFLFFFCKPSKEEKLIWQQIHLKSHFRDGPFKKRNILTPLNSLAHSLWEDADVSARNGSHPLLIDMLWAALSFRNNIRLLTVFASGARSYWPLTWVLGWRRLTNTNISIQYLPRVVHTSTSTCT